MKTILQTALYLALACLAPGCRTQLPNHDTARTGNLADTVAKKDLRKRLSAIHAAEQSTLVEGKFVLGNQHLSNLAMISREIASGQHWEFIPDLIQILERHRERFRDTDVAGYVEPTWSYAEAINTVAVSRKAHPYLIELAASVKGPLWKMTLIDAISATYTSIRTVDEAHRKALAELLTELSTGPLGTSPTQSVQILKEALGLTSPIERLVYANAKRTADDEGFLAVKAIEFSNKIGNGHSECHVTTVSSGGAGARHWRAREMLWIFQSPAPQFEPTKARLVFSGIVMDALSGNLNNDRAITTYRFFDSGSRVGETVNWPMRRQAALNDRIEATTTTTVWQDPHDKEPSIHTTRSEYMLKDGRYVPLHSVPTSEQE
ncbi:MAG: hypothetical protein WCN95_10375 [bacterium]